MLAIPGKEKLEQETDELQRKAGKQTPMEIASMALMELAGPLALTKNQMLKSLGGRGREMVHQLGEYIGKYGKEGIDIPASKATMRNSLRSLGGEIRSAPEGVFDPITKLEFSEGLPTRLHSGSEINLNPLGRDFNPKALRHELSHAWIGKDISTKSNYRDLYHTAAELGDKVNPYGEEFMSRKYPYSAKHTGPTTPHFYHPEEIAADIAEGIPLKGFKTTEDYSNYLNKLYNSSREEAANRTNAARRKDFSIK